MNADGSGVHLFAADGWDDMMPSWSRDGHWVYFACRPSGVLQVRKKALGDGSTVQLTKHGGGEPREAPDGRPVFYGIPDKGVRKIEGWRRGDTCARAGRSS
jgi:Tol biopolymer transport system component